MTSCVRVEVKAELLSTKPAVLTGIERDRMKGKKQKTGRKGVRVRVV